MFNKTDNNVSNASLHIETCNQRKTRHIQPYVKYKCQIKLYNIKNLHFIWKYFKKTV
jgi:hypothetical protein